MLRCADATPTYWAGQQTCLDAFSFFFFIFFFFFCEVIHVR